MNNTNTKINLCSLLLACGVTRSGGLEATGGTSASRASEVPRLSKEERIAIRVKEGRQWAKDIAEARQALRESEKEVIEAGELLSLVVMQNLEQALTTEWGQDGVRPNPEALIKGAEDEEAELLVAEKAEEAAWEALWMGLAICESYASAKDFKKMSVIPQARALRGIVQKRREGWIAALQKTERAKVYRKMQEEGELHITMSRAQELEEKMLQLVNAREALEVLEDEREAAFTKGLPAPLATQESEEKTS